MTSIRASMRRYRRPFSISIFLLSAGWASAGAPDAYSITGSVVAASGVYHASNACLILASTVGQATAGVARQLPLPNHGFSIVAGFWPTFPPSNTDSLMNDNFEVCQ